MRRFSCLIATLAAAAGIYCLWLATHAGRDWFVFADSFLFFGVAGLGFGVALMLSYQGKLALISFAAGAGSLLLGQMAPAERLPVVVSAVCLLGAGLVGLLAMLGKGPAVKKAAK